jgi:periplasmic divalent cation tolerance protein
MTKKFLVVYTTFPNLGSARRIVSGLVKRKLAACGSIFKLYSIYRWQGKIEKNPEYGALIKIKQSKYRAVERFIKDNHPYDLPEVIAWNIDKGQKDYLKWIDNSTD